MMLKRTFCRNCALVLFILESILAKDLRNDETAAEAGHKEMQNANPVSAIKHDEEGQKHNQLWPLGVVPYYLDHSSFDGLVAERVRLVMNSIEESSCIQFKPIIQDHYESSWIHITNPDRVRECVHDSGTRIYEGKIVMVLGFDCLQWRDILHTLMHALGFKDEVAHPYRDQFVRIKWDNINPKYRTLFHLDYLNFPTRTTEYDPMSIMHFHDRAFTKNGQATIEPLIPGLAVKPSKELSALDKVKLRQMFGHECNRRKVGDLVDVCKTALKEEVGGGNQVNNDKQGNYNNQANNDYQANSGNDAGTVNIGEDHKEGENNNDNNSGGINNQDNIDNRANKQVDNKPDDAAEKNDDKNQVQNESRNDNGENNEQIMLDNANDNEAQDVNDQENAENGQDKDVARTSVTKSDLSDEQGTQQNVKKNFKKRYEHAII